MSLGFRTAVSTFGGLASLIATWLIAVTGGKLSPSLLPDRPAVLSLGALTVIQRHSRCANQVVIGPLRRQWVSLAISGPSSHDQS